jgi:hypothetical protein
MANEKIDPEVLAHLEWLGFVRPTGLVVAAPALVRAGAILDRRDVEGQKRLRECVAERVFNAKEGAVPYLPDFRRFAESVLGWSFSPKGYAGTTECPIPSELEVPLPDYGETLRPDFAVRELEPKDGSPQWQLLVRLLEPDQDLDQVVRGHGQLEASAHSRMERLLRQTDVPAGLLFNGCVLRLVSAPRGENSGWLDFRIADMVQTAGRPISTALRLLLSQPRLLSLPRAQRLSALLDDSRKFQNEVSERLAEQVLHALYELLRGFQAAHDASNGELLRQPLLQHPDDVYRALLTVILRLVFLLYAEERDMLPEDETFMRYYSLAGLYERLREDVALFPDTMDQRYGAWAQLLVLFRMICDGAESGTMRLPKRHGVLFDPHRFPFLEGRLTFTGQQDGARIDPPLVSDGRIFRALDNLLVLDGERISYRALDVEQIGSVYETMMGFRLETTRGRSVAIKPQKKQGAPTAIDLEALLTVPSEKRTKWLQDRAGRKFTDTVKNAVSAAAKVEDLHAALLPTIDLAATPDLLAKGAMVLQPSEERRRSGSHYTPRILTEQIVRTTLEPILARLRAADGRPPRPAQILDLKVCDLAMGSGAFLVETCRQLGDALVEAWHAYGEAPTVPSDEDEVIFARRLIAQRCLYGVDRNPVAVDLAKVSLWLVTLAKDHALTFVDHALRHGDSLVGLSRKQIEALNWDASKPILKGLGVREPLEKATDLRKRIREADELVSDPELREMWHEAQLEIGKVRLFGDLIVAAFFEHEKAVERDARRSEYASAVLRGDAERYHGRLQKWRHADPPLAPFHWEIEFPEVFERENPGFDAIVGNPPFAGKNTVAAGNVAYYPGWLLVLHAESHGNADLVAHFFRCAFDRTRKDGAFGLIATKTIRQGDTRATGLEWIRNRNGIIYSATRRVPWPGQAAVIISVIHVYRGNYRGLPQLDGEPVDRITAHLFHHGPDGDPARLMANSGICFQGVTVHGIGFTFDDSLIDKGASGVSKIDLLVSASSRNSEIIRPLIGWEEITRSPTQSPERYVIDFSEYSEEEARQWPALMEIVEQRVKPGRLKDKRAGYRRYWWQFAEKRPELNRAKRQSGYVLVTSAKATTHLSFARMRAEIVFTNATNVIVDGSFGMFAMLQSRVHEVWARFFGSSMKDDLTYTSSSCFETFPFCERGRLEPLGREYYEFRATTMLTRGEGLTDVYNRFHNPEEHSRDILKLRDLHTAMDRAVLDAYGWNDIKIDCEFLLDYEIDEEEWGNKKKPWRYRWPDEVRDEVLARLLELNVQRAKEEARSGAAAEKKSRKKLTAMRSRKTPAAEDLFS